MYKLTKGVLEITFLLGLFLLTFNIFRYVEEQNQFKDALLEQQSKQYIHLLELMERQDNQSRQIHMKVHYLMASKQKCI